MDSVKISAPQKPASAPTKPSASAQGSVVREGQSLREWLESLPEKPVKLEVRMPKAA